MHTSVYVYVYVYLCVCTYMYMRIHVYVHTCNYCLCLELPSAGLILYTHYTVEIKSSVVFVSLGKEGPSVHDLHVVPSPSRVVLPHGWVLLCLCRQVKKVLQFMTYMLYYLRLELSFLMDEFCCVCVASWRRSFSSWPTCCTISVSSCPSLWMSSVVSVSSGEEGPSVHDLHVVLSPSRVVLPYGWVLLCLCRQLKKVLQFMTYMLYHLCLELSFLMDEFCCVCVARWRRSFSSWPTCRTISVSSCPSLLMSSVVFVSPGEEGPSVHDLHVVPSPSRVVLPCGWVLLCLCRQVKKVLQFMTYMSYHLLLELSFLVDEFCCVCVARWRRSFSSWPTCCTISVLSCPSSWMSSVVFVSPGEEGPSVHDLHVVPSPSWVVLPHGWVLLCLCRQVKKVLQFMTYMLYHLRL